MIMHAITRITASLGWLALSTAVFVALSGCETEPDSHLVSAPPPAPPVAVQTVTTTSSMPVVAAYPTGATTILVTQAPPAAQQEVPPPRPSSDYIWVGGYWTWIDSRYEWTSGHWEVPPRRGATWVPPRWEQEGGSFRFYNGYWD